MRISILLILLLFSAFSQKAERDPRLVGKWMFLYDLDPNGEVVKNEFYGKKYVTTYHGDGRMVHDPQMFRDADRRHGIKTPFDYSDIPILEWKTTNNETLTLTHAMGTLQNRYGFAGDTLIIGTSKGYTAYHLRVK
jgi:hypothetical protein